MKYLIALFVIVLAAVSIITDWVIYGDAPSWLFPVAFFGFVLGYAGGNAWMFVGNCLTAILVWGFVYFLILGIKAIRKLLR